MSFLKDNMAERKSKSNLDEIINLTEISTEPSTKDSQYFDSLQNSSIIIPLDNSDDEEKQSKKTCQKIKMKL